MRGFDTARVRHLSLRAREVYASEGSAGGAFGCAASAAFAVTPGCLPHR